MILVAVAIVVLIAFVGLATDVGLLWVARLRMQSAADAGALAGADALLSGLATAPDAARAATTANGFTDGAGTTANSYNVSVTVNDPPVSGTHTGVSGAVEVIVAQTQPTYFLRVMPQFAAIPVSARAVAIPAPAGCIYALDPTGSQSFLDNSGAIDSSCGIMVNSNSSTAFNVNSGASVSAVGGIGVVGGTLIHGAVSPTPITGIASFSDPLSSRTVPVRPSAPNAPSSYCAGAQNVTVNGGAASYGPGCYNVTLNGGTLNLNGSGNYVIQGATLNGNSQLNLTGGGSYYFTGGVNFNGAVAAMNGAGAAIYYFPNGMNTQGSVNLNGSGSYYFGGGVNLNSGTFNCGGSGSYYFNNGINVNSGVTADLSPGYYGGGINVNGGGAVINLAGDGTYYFDGNVIDDTNGTIQSQTAGGTPTYVTLYFDQGTFTENSSAILNLSAPTSGAYEAILIYQSRTNSAAAYINTGANVTLNGALYMPDARVTINGGWVNAYSLIVGYDIVDNAGALTVNANYTSLQDGPPIKQTALVE